MTSADSSISTDPGVGSPTYCLVPWYETLSRGWAYPPVMLTALTPGNSIQSPSTFAICTRPFSVGVGRPDAGDLILISYPPKIPCPHGL